MLAAKTQHYSYQPTPPPPDPKIFENFEKKNFFLKKIFFGQKSTFLGGLGGTDELFGVPIPPWGVGKPPKNSLLPPYTP